MLDTPLPGQQSELTDAMLDTPLPRQQSEQAVLSI